MLFFQITFKTLPCSTCRTGGIDRGCSVVGGVLAPCRHGHRYSRPGYPVTAVQHADGRLRESGRRVQRRAVRTDRSVIMTNLIKLIIDYFLFFFFCIFSVVKRRERKSLLKTFIIAFHNNKLTEPKSVFWRLARLRNKIYLLFWFLNVYVFYIEVPSQIHVSSHRPCFSDRRNCRDANTLKYSKMPSIHSTCYTICTQSDRCFILL